jgi:predicted HicB family RNase H-like nuclease
MSKATYPLKLPLSVKKAAQRLAKEDGVSLNQWIAAAVAEKIGPPLPILLPGSASYATRVA